MARGRGIGEWGEEGEIRNMGPKGHIEYRGWRHERHTAKGTWGHRGMGIGGMWPLGVASICPVRSLGGSPHFSPIGSGIKEYGSIGLVMPMLVCPYPLPIPPMA